MVEARADAVIQAEKEKARRKRPPSDEAFVELTAECELEAQRDR